MADLSDVEEALVVAATLALYPIGTDKPSVIGTSVRLFRGWPLIRPLEMDLSVGVSNVSVFSVPGTTRDVTRWGPASSTTSGSCTLAVETYGTSVTFSGLGGAGQVAGLLVDGLPFVYRGNAGDTPELVAAVLAEAVQAIRPCWLSCNTITVPKAFKLIGRVAADGTTLTEWARQSQDIRLAIWSPSPGGRDQICSVIGCALATTSFLTMADGSAGRLRYRSSAGNDDHQDVGQYRRDLIYDVEYGTSVQTTAPAMLFGSSEVNGNPIYA